MFATGDPRVMDMNWASRVNNDGCGGWEEGKREKEDFPQSALISYRKNVAILVLQQ